jgi:hypothetical protein
MLDTECDVLLNWRWLGADTPKRAREVTGEVSVTPLVAVGTLVFTFVNFLTYLFSKNWNGVLTQAIAWAAGVAGIFIASATQYAGQVRFGSHALSGMDPGTKIFLGLIATSILSTVNEIKKAIDAKDSAEKVPLLKSVIPPIPTRGPN